MEYREKVNIVLSVLSTLSNEINKLESVMIGSAAIKPNGEHTILSLTDNERVTYMASLQTLKDELDKSWDDLNRYIINPIANNQAVNMDWLKNTGEFASVITPIGKDNE
jgi:hypothetical protein